MADHQHELLGWMDAFAEAVRTIDFDRGIELFDPGADVADGLGCLVDEQWRFIWPHTERFRFIEGSVSTGMGGDGLLAWTMGLWESSIRETGPEGRRRGRATILLRRRETSEPWRAFHTHFSRLPSESDASERTWSKTAS